PSENEKAIKYAIDELIRGGTTTLVDHRSPDCPPIETPFREMLFLELIGPSKSKAEESRRNGLKWLEENDDLERLCHLTPHSLYSVHPDILQEVFSAGTTLSLHLLESDEEEQFFRSRQGPLFELVRSRGGSPLRAESPVAWIEEHRSNDTNILLIHGNYLKEDEIRRLKGQNAFVIHCPGSHRFFGPRAFPHESYIRCGIRIGLGTDSLASNESLNMLRQMKLMKETTHLGEEDILRMATLNGAMAIGMENEIGTLEVGKKADIVGVPLLNQKVDPYEALLLPDQVSFSMVRGRVIFCTHP
ncbi:MAG: amidohydrolase family protein, partial [Deltaproteobacteria bacterium]|nr:amidohydrolase family protein [Deltaproteobacteria bacterium]